MVVDFINIEEGFKDIILLNLKINIVLIIFSLPELSIGYNISIEIRNIGYIL